MKEITPSLKDIDHVKFRFYKPPVIHLISVLDPHPGFQLTREHLRSLLLILGHMLWHNKVRELPQDESSPEFVMQLKEELCLSCVIQPNNDMAMTQSLLHPVRSFLGDKAFREHFINPGLGDGSGSETCHVMAIEALHYADTIVDHHISDQNAYRARAEPHI
ncbi:hypothetical protein EDB89DRAFT_1915801 [Lactarius sanguifluus]|nr:hypothetical protein EDB89DRAFT_1915801 [Lactarius sanguifluus]